MLDSTQILTNVADMNIFNVVSSFKFYQGTGPIDFYVRLYQSDRKDRYIPDLVASVKLEFLRSDAVGGTNPSQTVTTNMTAPFADDRSIWKVSLTVADISKIVSGGFRVTLTEGASPNTITTAIYNKSSIQKSPTSDEAFCS